MLVYLSLGDAFRKYLSIPPMDMDVGGDLILGLYWISSRDLQYLFQACQAAHRSAPCRRRSPALAGPGPARVARPVRPRYQEGCE